MNRTFGTDGIRGSASQFTPDFLSAVLDGLIAYRGTADFRLLIGGDTRTSTARILSDLARLAATKHISCASAGILPTPAINFYLQHAGYDFAIDVTASHNPASSNGLKVLERPAHAGAAAKLSAPGRAAIEAALETALGAQSSAQPSPQPDQPAAQSPRQPQSLASVEDVHAAAVAAYLDHLRTYLGPCDFLGLRLGLDCANGATSVIGDQLFRKFGAAVTLIHSTHDFNDQINAACGSTHLESLQQLVQTEQLDFGIAFDGDGDRCLLVDSRGQIIDGDQILVILARQLGLGSFVTTVVANQGLFDWADQNHFTVAVSDVGDQNVFALMRERAIPLGGETCGHIILPEETMGDGMLTALMVTKAVASASTTLGQLAVVPILPQLNHNLPATAAQKARLADPAVLDLRTRTERALADHHVRILIRPSGTEDLIRLTIWGDSEPVICAALDQLVNDLQEIL